MNAAELIAQLSELDPNTTIVQSRDAEGNGYSPTSQLAVGFYRPESWWDADKKREAFSTYAGEFHQPLDDEDRAGGRYSKEDEYEPQPEDVPAVCLWPTN